MRWIIVTWMMVSLVSGNSASALLRRWERVNQPKVRYGVQLPLFGEDDGEGDAL
jgi:hypothetical protein